MRRGISFFGLLTALVAALLCFVPLGLWVFAVPVPTHAPPVQPPPPIAVIEGASDLVATKVHLSTSLEGENKHYKGRWLLHGEALLGVDLSKVAYRNLRMDLKQAVLSLPQPHVVSTKVDHERSEEISIKWVAWVPLSSRQALRDEVWKMADRKLLRLAKSSDYLDLTRQQTERVLGQLFAKSGWTVTFAWEAQTDASSEKKDL
jgi:hypothetical protein